MEKYNNVLNFYKEYIKLEQIVRKGWLMCNVPAERLESVADHTLQLIMLSSVITKELNISVDSKRLTEMLLIHDLGEAVVGDISDVETDRISKKAQEADAVRMLLNNLNPENAKYYYDLWNEMESQNTELSKFAYLLDKVDAVIKASIYEEEYSLDGLFDEFSGFQKEKGTFENSVLGDFFDFVNSSHNKKTIK